MAFGFMWFLDTSIHNRLPVYDLNLSGFLWRSLRIFSGLLGVAVSPLAARARPAFAAEVRPLRASVRGGASAGTMGTNEVVGRVCLGFRILTLVTVLSILALVTIGGVVRLTESGLGCPDWPLCHGKIVPPLDTHTLIEYSHRLMASVVGLLVLVTTLIVWRSYRKQPWLFFPATLGLLLLVVQVVLGGITVLRELSAGVVVAHLATAEALMASMVVVCVIAVLGHPQLIFRRDAEGRWSGFGMLTLGAVLAVYGLLLTGSYVAATGAAPSCGQSWPLCQGQLFPDGSYAISHMVHRAVALLVGALVVTVLILAWRRKRERSTLGWAAVVVGGLFLVQVLVGAGVVMMGFPLAARLLHLVMATLVWVGLAALAVLAYTVPKLSPRGVSHA